MSRSYVANGNIKPYRAVKIDTTADYKILQATDGAGAHGDRAVGISQLGTHLPPWAPLDDGYAAVAGEEIMVYEENDEPFILTGAAVTNGDLLKPDSDGRGITASVAADKVFAEALETASAANILIKCKVTRNRLVPA